jgi:hypothetical protein
MVGACNLEYPHTARVREAIQSHLLSADVGDIVAVPRFDADGDPIVEFRVSVVSDFTKLDPRELVRLTGHVRAAMREVNENSFPILRVMNKRDWDDLNNEAA